MLDKKSMVDSFTKGSRSLRVGFTAMAAAAAVIAFPKIASACTPYGLIYEKWQTDYAVLGNCVDDEHDDGLGGRIETFQYGYVDWIYPREAATVHGAIGAAWMSRYGGPASTGQPDGDEDGYIDRRQDFLNTAGGAYTWMYLVWNIDTYEYGGSCSAHSDHVCLVYGSIGQEWNDWLYTTDENYSLPTDEEYTYDGSNRKQHFQNGYEVTYNVTTLKTCTFQYSTFVHGVSAAGCALP